MAKFYDEQRVIDARNRAARIAERKDANHHAFVHLQAAELIGERLAVTKREFATPVLLFDGPFAPAIAEMLRANAPNIVEPFRLIPYPQEGSAVPDLEAECADLVVSVLDLHRSNNVAARFIQSNIALKPDGLFHAAIPVEGTLSEFQDCLMRAELDVTGGAAQRFDLFPEIRQTGNMLQQTGFRLPVCDVEQLVIRYRSLERLLEDIRGSGASAAIGTDQPVISRQTFKRCKEIYEKEFSDPDGRLRASFNLGFLSGWKEHESQQKPLKPGSAKQSLKDFL